MRKLINKSIMSSALLVLLVTFCLLGVSPSVLAAVNAGGDGQISGQLLDGSRVNAPLAGQSVTLQMAQGSTSQDLKTVTTDAQGSFSFPNLATDKTINYAVFARYQGAQYLSNVVTLNYTPKQQLKLTVYDATQSTGKIAITNATALFREPDINNKTITVSEAFSFKNLDIHTYVGSLHTDGKSKPNALLFSLPAGAKNINLQKGFTGYNVIQVDHGFATDAAVFPGDNDFAFSFDMPYISSSYAFTYTTFLPTVSLSFFVPPDIHTSSNVLTSQGLVNTINYTRPYNLLNAKQLPAQKNVDLHLDGLLTQLPADTATSFNPWLIWLIVAGIVILATAGIVWFVLSSQRLHSKDAKKATGKKLSMSQAGKNGVTASDKANKAKPTTAKEREQALLNTLLKLDQDYEAGKLSKEVYEEQRGKMKARLRSILSEKESAVH